MRCSRSGAVRRRARQKRPAREAITEALVGFEQLGAATWVERARRELGSIGGRAREDGLTPAERRVAELVAAGERIVKSPPSCFSASGPWPAISHTSTPSWACARAPSLRAGWSDVLVDEQSSDVLTFPAERRDPSVEGVPSYLVETYLARAQAGERTDLNGAHVGSGEPDARERTGPGSNTRFTSRGRALLVRR